MRLAFIKRKYVPYGGGEGYLMRLIHACLDAGDEVHLITTSWDNRPDLDVRIHLVDATSRLPAINAVLFSRGAAELVDHNNFDVVFSLERTEKQDIWRAGEGVHRVWIERRKLFDPRWKVWTNKWDLRHRALLQLEQRCVANTRAIIANSDMVCRDIESVYPGARGKITVIRNGVHPQVFNTRNRARNRAFIRQRLGLAEPERLLLFAGSGFRRKGLAELMEALPAIQRSRLVVLGRDDTRAWKKKARQRSLSDRIIFLPPQSDMVPYYHAADAVIQPTWFDPFPNVGLETLFCGTPLVTTEYAGTAELIVPGENGEIVTSPADCQALAAAINRVIESPRDEEKVLQISESAKDCNMEENARRTIELIHSLK